ncbi:MAG: hypothetical protein LWX08_14885 [Deltaproteobacteria bacterium]|nr:hypothetical protein [Deltaproteobacteria bacterium]
MELRNSERERLGWMIPFRMNKIIREKDKKVKGTGIWDIFHESFGIVTL